MTHTGYAELRLYGWEFCGWLFTDAAKGVFAGGHVPKIVAPAKVTSVSEKS
jgi:hypothetical protein